LVPYTQKKHYLEISPEHLDPHLSKSVNIEMDPGDVVLFHNLLFHQGLPNHSKTIRWSLDWRYQDATQPTMRPSNGHLARTQREPGKAVVSADQWTRLASA
jgi:ectoine hydroxylase-related dioxygenase (phytanoyl-CoA dioxygenase family)